MGNMLRIKINKFVVHVLNFRSTISRGFTFLTGFINIQTQKNTKQFTNKTVTNKTKTTKYIPGSECGVRVYYGAMLFYKMSYIQKIK